MSVLSCIRLNTGKYGPELNPYLDTSRSGLFNPANKHLFKVTIETVEKGVKYVQS